MENIIGAYLGSVETLRQIKESRQAHSPYQRHAKYRSRRPNQRIVKCVDCEKTIGKVTAVISADKKPRCLSCNYKHTAANHSVDTNEKVK